MGRGVVYVSHDDRGNGGRGAVCHMVMEGLRRSDISIY